MRTIMGAIAEYDKQMIVLKLRAARQRKKAREGCCEGCKPFGQTDEEQTTIARMKVLRAEGLPLASIAARHNKERLRPQVAKRWYASSVLAILKRTN